MSSTNAAASAAHSASARAPAEPGFLGRLFAAWQAYQMRVARSYVVPHLRHLPDVELLKRGYTTDDIRALRREPDSAPQHWV